MYEWRYSIDKTNKGEIMRIVSGMTIAEDRLVTFQAILAKVGDRFTVGSLAASRKYGKPYQCAKRERASITRQVEYVINGGLASEVQHLWVTEQTIVQHLPRVRRLITMDNNETQVTKIEARRCQVAPKVGAKNQNQCPYAASEGSDICKLHTSLEKRYGVRFRRVGEPVEVKAAEVKAAPEDSTIHVDVQATPENVDKAVKKLSKKEKVRQVLAILQTKQAEKVSDQPPSA
jgi:hypothetical protein